MLRGLLPLLLVALLATGAAAQTSPLIMKHADSLAVARKRGTLLLQGTEVFGNQVESIHRAASMVAEGRRRVKRGA